MQQLVYPISQLIRYMAYDFRPAARFGSENWYRIIWTMESRSLFKGFFSKHYYHNGDSSMAYKKRSFANVTLTKAEKDDLRNQTDSGTFGIDDLTDFLMEGYKFNVTPVPDEGFFRLSATALDGTLANQDFILTVRAGDWLKGLLVLAYAHEHVLNKNWSVAAKDIIDF